ncbi:MAG: PQQ-binding-like beta-propeller repeat protein [Planctomycetales bacterium]|nr:PQQ-binding-like beta-propeller repeat protein [Planctomycetales bacterium]
MIRISCACLSCFCLLSLASFVEAADWRQFRGSDNSSVVTDGQTPSELAENAVAWSAELPGKGPSSPIVVSNRVVVTSAGGRNQDRMHVMAFDVQNGQELWRREFWATGRTLTHPSSGNAAPTPASDGERIYAFFSSNDLVCLDLDGNLQWYRGLASDYPKAGNDVGMSSSPVVIGDTVIVQVENQGDSFAAGLDARTGKNRWRIERERVANWASPLVLHSPDKQPVVLLQNGHGVAAHDPVTGKELWRHEASCDAITSPATDGQVVVMASEGLSAIKVPQSGGSPEALWSSNKLSTGASSPIVHDGKVYTVNRAGVLNCGNLTDGEVTWKLRLGIGRQWATPAVAGDLMYCFDSDGKAAVVRLADEPEVVATAEFDEGFQASPAVANGAVYIRTDKRLLKFAM